MAVRDLDLSIDAGIRAHEEVYTPEGHIRQHLLSGEEAEAEQEVERAQEPEAEQESDRERDRSEGFDIDEPF